MRHYPFCFLILLLISSCSEPTEKTSFESWFQEHRIPYQTHNCHPKVHRETFKSKSLEINGLAQSMTGAMSSQEVKIDTWGEELIWITECELKISKPNSEDDTQYEHLCHSIINYSEPKELPWNILTMGTDKRVFTLSQGVSKVDLPEGFAIPMSLPAKLSIGNQVLNLNDPNLKTELNFDVTLGYHKNHELCEKPIALYQQAVFVTKKIEGPEGGFYQKDSTFRSIKGDMDTAFAQCGISYENGYDPYSDPYGRKFTGHWTVAEDSIEILKTNVTPMLNLKYDTRIHHIAVHVQPYAHSLELVDKTTGESLFKALVKNQSSMIGIVEVDSYSSKEGIPVFIDHEYQLISTYLNPAKRNDITAMATMFLYLREGSVNK